MQVVYVVMNLILGFCRPWASAQGLLMATLSYTSVLLWVWLQFELVCDDPRNTVLMMPPSLSLEAEERRRDEKVGNYSGGQVRMSCVWEERGGKN